MAKRVIQECDLTKQEYDPEETVIITIKKKGKAKGRSYDLSPDAAARLEQQLVAGNDAALESYWSFSSHTKKATGRRTLEDLEEEEPEGDARVVAEKKRELREAGVLEDESPREVPTDGPVGKVLGVPKSKCPTRHMNKGRIQTTMRDGRRYAYRVCPDCQTRIPEKTADDKLAYRNQKIPKGVNVRDLSN